MNNEPLEIVRGSGNVYCDYGHPSADRGRLRAIVAARLRRGGDQRRGAFEPAEPVDRARFAQGDGDLRRCPRRRGAGHRGTDWA